MVYEHYKVANVFGLVMGGRVVPDIRNGNVRCRGVFRAGDHRQHVWRDAGAVFIWLWIGAKARVAAVRGSDLVSDYHDHCFFEHWNLRRRSGDWGAMSLATSQTHAVDALGTCGRDPGIGAGDEGPGLVPSGAG